MHITFDSQTVIVTGAAHGFGRAIAVNFAARGATHAFVAPEGGFSLRTVREPGLDRPWTRAPRARPAANATGPGSADDEGAMDRDEDAFAREERAPDLRD